MEQPTTEHFEQLPLARADMPASTSGQYRVYSDAKNFKRVEAASAVEAMELAGMTSVYKIERESIYKASLIMPNFTAAVAAVAAAVAGPAGEAAPAT